VLQRGPEVPHRAEHAVAEPVHALVHRAGGVLAPRRHAHPLELRHVHPPARLDECLHHAVITAGCKVGAALADDGCVAVALDHRQTAQGVRELVTVSQHRAVRRRGPLEKVEGIGQPAAVPQRIEGCGHSRVAPLPRARQKQRPTAHQQQGRDGEQRSDSRSIHEYYLR